MIQSFLGTEQRCNTHRGELENQKSNHCNDLGCDQRNVERFPDAHKVSRSVIVSDDRLCADGNTDQNRNQDLIDFHYDTGCCQGDLRPVHRIPNWRHRTPEGCLSAP